jgi:hypothetical protein
LQEIFDEVESHHGHPFWKSNLLTTLTPYESLTFPKQIRGGKPNHSDCPLLITTYEFYFNYVMKYHPNRCKIRKLKQILAYKGRHGVQGENLESNNAGSRTNLDGNIRILSREEEDKFSFDSFSDSCKYISKKCKQKGWDVVTFQNHTRIGSHEDRKRHESEIYEILSN